MILKKLIKFVTAGFLSVVALAVMPRVVAAGPNVAVLAFGLVGSQSVFESEAKGAAAILGQRLGADDVVAFPTPKLAETLPSKRSAPQCERPPLRWTMRTTCSH